MYLTETQPDEFKTQPKNLNNKKASNIFGKPANFLKFPGDKIQSFTFLINTSTNLNCSPKSKAYSCIPNA